MYPNGVPARVVARSAPLRPGAALWPFPDLAILRLEADIEHPCVRLAGGYPTDDANCHTWGYARRERGLDPPGSPATFRFEGIDGDGYLRLKGGQAEPGLSGAPLVCPTRRAVVGMVVASRAVDSDLGGWATPMAALARIPDGQRILALNASAAGADWDAVLPPAPDPGRWITYRRPPATPTELGDAPAALLDATTRVVPFQWTADFDDLVSWCLREDLPQAARIYAGPPGAGKTRLAIELHDYLRNEHGWGGGLLRAGNPSAAELASREPMLVVVDDANAAVGQLDSLLTALVHGGGHRRLLLLARSAEPLRQSAATRVMDLDARRLIDVTPHELPALAPVARARFASAAIDAFRAVRPGQPAASPDAVLRLAADTTDPLSISATALLTVLDPDGSRGNVGVALLRQEQRHWLRMIGAALPNLDDTTRWQALLLPTLFQARDLPQAQHALAALPGLARRSAAKRDGYAAVLAELLHQSYPGDQGFWCGRLPGGTAEELLLSLVPLHGALAAATADLDLEQATAVLTAVAHALGLQSAEERSDLRHAALIEELALLLDSSPATFLPAAVLVAARIARPAPLLELVRARLEGAENQVLDAVFAQLPAIAVEWPDFAVEAAAQVAERNPAAGWADTLRGRAGPERLAKRAEVLTALAGWLSAVTRYKDAAQWQREAVALTKTLANRSGDPDSAGRWRQLLPEARYALARYCSAAGQLADAAIELDTARTVTGDRDLRLQIALLLHTVRRQQLLLPESHLAMRWARVELADPEAAADPDLIAWVHDGLADTRAEAEAAAIPRLQNQLHAQSLEGLPLPDVASAAWKLSAAAPSKFRPLIFAGAAVVYGGSAAIDSAQTARLRSAHANELSVAKARLKTPSSRAEWSERAQLLEKLGRRRGRRGEHVLAVLAFEDADAAWQLAGPDQRGNQEATLRRLIAALNRIGDTSAAALAEARLTPALTAD